MRPEGCEPDLLRTLAWMPFLDRQEMVAVSGWSRAAVYEAVEKLETAGACASVLHSADPFPPARRFHLTAAGLRRLADEKDTPLDILVRSRPVSAQWRRNLMERLDALAVIYRMAVLLSNVAYPIRFRWYRASPLDAAVTLPDGKTVGIVRQGHHPRTDRDSPSGSGGCAKGRCPALSSSSWRTTCGSGTPGGCFPPPTCPPSSPWSARRSRGVRTTGYGDRSR